MKPINSEKLYAVLDLAAEKLRRNEGCLTIQTTEKTVRLPFCTIRYLDIQKNHVTLHAQKDYSIKLHLHLSEIEAGLDYRSAASEGPVDMNLNLVQRVSKA